MSPLNCPVEEIHFAVAAIENVVITINFHGASGAGHAQRLATAGRWVQSKSDVPFELPNQRVMSPLNYLPL